MQKFTGKEIAALKTQISELLNAAIKYHQECENARRIVEDSQKIALWFGWNAGLRLNKIKPNIPVGDWLDWLELNFCKPANCAIRTAQIYMKIDNENANLRSTLETQRVARALPDLELLAQLKFDSIRKYAISFVPEKAQPEHENNIKFPRLALFANIVNEFERLFNRHVDGLQLIDLEEVREETKSLYRFLKCVHETPDLNPFA
jgi:hypothetical protein